MFLLFFQLFHNFEIIFNIGYFETMKVKYIHISKSWRNPFTIRDTK